ncbi:hypothetical protein AgCh_005180 [Apium graveolens]
MYIPWRYHILSFTAVFLFCLRQTASTQVAVIGAIIDHTSRAGMEANVALHMALQDITKHTNQTLVLHVMNSQGEPALAAITAKRLTDLEKVQVIIGPHTWQEVSRVVEISSYSHIPTLSLADSTPIWARERWPLLVEASTVDQYAQMKSLAAIVRSWNWQGVTIIYEEDIDSTYSRIIPILLKSLQQIGAEISQLVLLPDFTSSLSEELMRLKSDQCRVFVVHTSLKLATRLFQKAGQMQMMEKDYAWIATNTVSDLIHSVNLTAIFSMQGVLGVKRYIHEISPKFVDFKKRFRKEFSIEYPEEGNNEPGISAVEAYDAMWVVATSAVMNTQFANQSQIYLEKNSAFDFTGISGRIHIIERCYAQMLV